MANRSGFTITVSGSKEALHTVKAFLEKGLVERGRPSQLTPLDIRKLFGSIQSDMHAFVVLYEFGYPNPKYTVADPPFFFVEDEQCMGISGEAKWIPPLSFVEQLSSSYPELEFRLGASSDLNGDEWALWTAKRVSANAETMSSTIFTKTRKCV